MNYQTIVILIKCNVKLSNCIQSECKFIRNITINRTGAAILSTSVHPNISSKMINGVSAFSVIQSFVHMYSSVVMSSITTIRKYLPVSSSKQKQLYLKNNINAANKYKKYCSRSTRLGDA